MAEEQAQTKVKQHEDSEEQVVTPWVAHAGEGQTGIDYEKLISKRGLCATLTVVWQIIVCIACMQECGVYLFKCTCMYMYICMQGNLEVKELMVT